MAFFFPRNTVYNQAPSSANTSHHPLFRFLDDFEDFSTDAIKRTNAPQHLKSFTPKFDVREVSNAYELHGELPGIDQKDIEIEFTDENSLVIRGHIESSYSSKSPDAGEAAAGSETDHHKAHQPSVEDDKTDTEAATQTVTKHSSAAGENSQVAKKPADGNYWISERSVGQFSRTFNFPTRVNQEEVKASMKNGILSIVVPKAKKVETRKITIS